jgi:ArsR family transcriptional regulator
MAAESLVPSDYLERVAERFRLLGEPVRLQLLNLLHTRGEMAVQDLAEAAGISHANASKHLRQMELAGLLGRRKDGLHAYYQIADASLGGICLLVCAQIEREA